MQKNDFHGPATLCVAKEAGLDDDTAKAIAWADWYTDCTSLTQVKWPHQMFINNPGPTFHFADPEKIREYLYLILTDPTATPIAIGIALHTLQDTYAHKGFFGYCTKKNNTQPWLQYWPHYGHTGEGHTPDNVDAIWWDGRIRKTIVNRERFSDALYETYRILGGTSDRTVWESNSTAHAILTSKYFDYDGRGEAWVKSAGFPGLKFKDINKEMLAKYGTAFKAAAKRQKLFFQS